MDGVERAFSGYSVDDIPAARLFYEETLGFEVEQMDNGLLKLHLPGGHEVVVYPRPDHTPATFTVLNFAVADIEGAVAKLRERGVELNHYEGLGQDENGIARAGGPLIAWFSDPAGNILAVLEDV